MLSADDERSDVERDGSFVTVVSRRSVKRARHQSTQQRPQQPQQPVGNQHQARINPRRASVMIGVNNSTNRSTDKLRAARSIRKKAVFCVDNISNSCVAADLTSFVSALSVEVVSCFEVRPRRRRNEQEDSDRKDRKAFRLCIFDDHRDRLLNADMWPSSVIISGWVSKPRQPDEGAGRRDSAVDADETAGRTERSAQSTCQPAAAAAAAAVMLCNDDTILVANMECNSYCDDGS